MSGWRVGVDVGGTFTDIALVEESTGRVGVYKVPTIVDEPVSGVLDGVREGLRGEGLDPADVVYFGAGSTLAVNTIIQRTGVPTGLLITEGFRDVLEIRRTRLPDAPSFEAARPVPLVRRAHVREVRERIGADGPSCARSSRIPWRKGSRNSLARASRPWPSAFCIPTSIRSMSAKPNRSSPIVGLISSSARPGKRGPSSGNMSGLLFA